MKNIQLTAALLVLAAPVGFLTGCGGGGSGGGGSSVSPTATMTATMTATVGPTATVGARVLVVQLRDAAGKPVEGVVSLGAAPVAGVTVLATSGGDVTFNRNIAVGSTAVSAEVDGEVTKGTATIKASDSTVFLKLVIAPRVTPGPTGTPPPPPFGG